MRRSQRQSAAKVQKKFQGLDDDDGKESTASTWKGKRGATPAPQSKPTNKRRRKDSHDYEPDDTQDDDDSGGGGGGGNGDTPKVVRNRLQLDDLDKDYKPIETDIMIDAAVLAGEDAKSLFADEKQYSNYQQRKRRALIHHWRDFFVKPKMELRPIPKGITGEWKKEVQMTGSVHCPLPGCDRSFTTYAGVSYHFRRCGNPTVAGQEVSCKLCGESAPLPKRLLPHMAQHVDQLPPASDALMIGLMCYRVPEPKKPKKQKEKKEKKSKKSQKGKLRQLSSSEDYFATALEYMQGMRKDLFRDILFLPKVSSWSSWVEGNTNRGERLLPREKESCSFKLGHEDESWRKLGLFESVKSHQNTTFFVGGTAWAAAWTPLPANQDHPPETESILAVGVGLSLEDTHAFKEEDTEQGLIQFWSFAELSNHDKEPEAKLAFCISHVYGVIWGMEWTPFGNSWMPPDVNVTDYLPRLGLLAIACADCQVRILSIPHLQYLPHLKPVRGRGRKTTKIPIYDVLPVVVLEPPASGIPSDAEQSICRSLSWSRSHDSTYIAGGYGNGVIAVWDIMSTSTSLVLSDSTPDQKILMPLHSVYAHTSAVTSLSFFPSDSQSLLLASGGHLDRNIFIWNFSDTSSPSHVYRRSIVTDLNWIFRNNGLIASFDECFTNLCSNVVMLPLNQDLKLEKDRSWTLCQHKATVWSSSYNDWTNSEASGDAAGEVVVCKEVSSLTRRLHNSKRYRQFVRFPVYNVDVEKLTEQDKENGEWNSTKHESDKKEIPLRHYTYTSMSNNYGLVFNDNHVSSFVTIPVEDVVRVHSYKNMRWHHPTNFPLSSLTLVKWNPNKDSFPWLLTTGQSGLCRLTRCLFVKEKFRVLRIPLILAPKSETTDISKQEDEEEQSMEEEQLYYVVGGGGIDVSLFQEEQEEEKEDGEDEVEGDIEDYEEAEVVET